MNLLALVVTVAISVAAGFVLCLFVKNKLFSEVKEIVTDLRDLLEKFAAKL